MALLQYLQHGKLLWSTSKHVGGLMFTCRMLSCHSAVKLLKINFSNKNYVTYFSLQTLSRALTSINCQAISKSRYSSKSRIDNDENEDMEDDSEGETTELADIFENKVEMSSSEWKDVIELVSQKTPWMNAKSCDALMIRRCQSYQNYPLATSYLDHIKREGREINLATLGAYLQLCGQTVDQCGEERILQVYKQLTSQVKVMDSKLSKSAILGLTSTKEWRQSFTHLPIIRRMSQVCHLTYSAIIAAAFRNGDYDTGWEYMETMWKEGKEPQDKVFLEWVRQCGGAEKTEEKMALANILFRYLCTFEIFPQLPVIEEIAKLFKDSLGWSSHYVKLSSRGRCPACREELECLGVDEEEFKQLQEEFVPRVLHRSDIFISSSPKEWADFRDFVEEQRPFTTVVDGLNVAYACGNKPPRVRLQLLRDVVKQVCRRNPNGRVLVIGREHMKSWSPQNLFRNQQAVSLYTLNNIDMLRDHLFRLEQVPLRETFRRWQRLHQIMVIKTHIGFHLLDPAAFSTTAQQGKGGWHIPYDDGTPHQSYQVPRTWLCLQSTLPQRKRQYFQPENSNDDKFEDLSFEYKGNKSRRTNLDQKESKWSSELRISSSDTNLEFTRKHSRPWRKNTGRIDVKKINVSTLADILNTNNKE
ncbi:mitochondrial ribonuclease P catalytic subunit-like isoform X2 [Homarus americanus]|uniref:mitochondrial ribonuclease P catalytic subunit-like isoform X2 n=1 Tax=Homarus americanus TaxID=6706 RepID=UPI001C489F65|nr:mitochondrial ribonuclease P catalytic subunit-like isoform X2 [Homarus americanus]